METQALHSLVISAMIVSVSEGRRMGGNTQMAHGLIISAMLVSASDIKEGRRMAVCKAGGCPL